MSTCRPKSEKTLELKFERLLQATPEEAYDAWLSPATPGTPWFEKDELILDPKVNGFFYWLFNGNAHYGRFIELERPKRIEKTWLSRSTLGEESNVVVTFEKAQGGTLMTLIHTDLPDVEVAKGHEGGWNYFLDKLKINFAQK